MAMTELTTVVKTTTFRKYVFTISGDSDNEQF
jgi:hypothetical protein